MSHISFTYHIVWRTKRSERTISELHERDLYAYIHGICKQRNCFLYRINSMPDHIHLCVSIHPTISVSNFVQIIKQSTSIWIKEHPEWFPMFDNWGNGYAAFTYSANERDIVVEYIRNQKEHHHKKSFKDEYFELLSEFGLDPETDRFLED